MGSGRLARLQFQELNKASGRPQLNLLPSFVTSLRDSQAEAVEKIVAAFESVDVVVVDAPPGTGKTVLAEAVRLMMGVSGVYVCHSKALQDQAERDFDRWRVIKGRANYLPVYGMQDATCADCAGEKCQMCPGRDQCPYVVAKEQARRADVAVLNTSYFLAENNSGGGGFRGRGLVTLDECDTLEGELMNFVEARVPKRVVDRVGEPKFKTKPEAWKEWLDGKVVPELKAERGRLAGEDLALARRRQAVENSIRRLQGVSDHLSDKEGDSAWVAEYGDGNWVFKPVTVESFGPKCLWRHGSKFLLMSGSVVSADALLVGLGWKGNHSVVCLGSPFDVKNRLVRVRPAGSMSFKSQEKGKVVAGAAQIIMAEHPNDRVLVHSVSYATADLLLNALDNRDRTRPADVPRGTGAEKDKMVRAWLNSPNGVLISPSMDRGVDLADDKCRVQVVLKVPKPNIGDKQVAARLHSPGGQVWYAVQTVRTLIQMSGRVCRNEQDWGVTYILDRDFVEFYRRWRHLFPEWYREGVKWN